MAVFGVWRMDLGRRDHAAYVKTTSLKHHNRAEDSHVTSNMPALWSTGVVDIQSGCHELQL